LKPIHWIISFIWLGAILGVESISRSAFYSIWGLFTIGFAAYVWLAFSKQPIPLIYGILIAIVCRLAGFLFDPMLSDDYFRYVWDGMVMHQGINPMAYIPSYLLAHPELVKVDQSLYALLNSPDYHSVYPPIAQWIYYISFGINKLNLAGHILFYKALLLCADIIIFYLLGKLLIKNNQPINRLLIYALNPLIIIEYTGNLHFEGLMIAALLGAVLLAGKRNLILSSIFMTISIASKMLTLVLMPFMPAALDWKKISIWSLLTLGLTFIFFWLTFGQHEGWIESIGLWFQSFEFNASIYYIVREIGFMITGYNTIKWIGPLLGIITLLSIGITWLYYRRKKDFPWSSAMVYVLTFYFVMTTTVHPWYLGTLLALSVLSLHTYPIVWTYLVFLSYSHYAGGGFHEKYLFIAVEYALLFFWIAFEIRSKNLELRTLN